MDILTELFLGKFSIKIAFEIRYETSFKFGVGLLSQDSPECEDT